MKQFALFDQAEVSSAQSVKPSSFRTALAVAQAKAKVMQRANTKPKLKLPNKPPVSYTLYRVCHHCDRFLSIPGLGTSYCKASGWITRSQNQWAGGES